MALVNLGLRTWGVYAAFLTRSPVFTRVVESDADTEDSHMQDLQIDQEFDIFPAAAVAGRAE